MDCPFVWKKSYIKFVKTFLEVRYKFNAMLTF